jgi:hypothetical protein
LMIAGDSTESSIPDLESTSDRNALRRIRRVPMRVACL